MSKLPKDSLVQVYKLNPILFYITYLFGTKLNPINKRDDLYKKKLFVDLFSLLFIYLF